MGQSYEEKARGSKEKKRNIGIVDEWISGGGGMAPVSIPSIYPVSPTFEL
jgi:hypothetical protein